MYMYYVCIGLFAPVGQAAIVIYLKHNLLLGYNNKIYLPIIRESNQHG